MELQVLPLAITMMAGPQILSAIAFVTAERAVQLSLAFLTGVLAAAAAGVAAARGLAAVLGGAPRLGDPADPSAAGTIIQLVLVALLAAAAVRSYVRRETVEPPKWLGALQAAGPRKAFTVGLLVILLMPSDVVVMLTVGVHLAQRGAPLRAALPFIAATLLIAALPLLAYLLFRKRAERAMPRFRDWLNAQSWLVNIIVYAIFIVLILPL